MKPNYLDAHALILAVEDAIEQPAVVIAAAERADCWDRSETASGLDQLIRNSDTFRLSHHVAYAGLVSDIGAISADKLVHESVQRVLNVYSEGNRIMVSRDQGYLVVRYTEGGFYGLHYDSAGLREKHPELWDRRVTYIAYLNDDFEGGELVFPAYGVTVRPRAGLVVMFPSGYTHLHRAMPVRGGRKYIATTWLV